MKQQQATPSVDNALWRVADWFPALDGGAQTKLREYLSELLKFNPKINLISRNTERDADEAHIADCLLASQTLASANIKLSGYVHDLGSGNGLPGLVFAILMPEVKFQLVESDSRKGEFLKHAAHTLGLSNVAVNITRVEMLPANSIKCAITRGFASITKACVAGNKVFAPGATFFHLKGNNWSTEIAEIPPQLLPLWTPELVGEYALPVSQARRGIVSTRRK